MKNNKYIMKKFIILLILVLSMGKGRQRQNQSTGNTTHKADSNAFGNALDNAVDDCKIVKATGRTIGREAEYVPAQLLRDTSALSMLDDPVRVTILKILHKDAMYPSEIARKLKMNEQKVYYHIKQLSNAGMIKVVQREEIRGTTAKRFKARHLNFALLLEENWKKEERLGTMEMAWQLKKFLENFISENRLNSKIIVGSPDPHGPYKARARDGHYAAALSLFLGSYVLPDEFPVILDVEVDIKKEQSNFFVVGGPVTNLVLNELNQHMKYRFSDSQPWGIVARDSINASIHTEDSAGIIARIQNPFTKKGFLIVLAGNRFIGTKVAVMGLTQFTDKILANYRGQNEYYAVVQGYDLNGDGSIDSVELVE